MDQALLTPLNQLETSLNSLLTSLTSTNTFTSAPAATQSLLAADDALSSALVDLKQHQENYTRILTLRAEADRLQNQLRDIIRTCVDLRNEIGEIHPSILDETDTEDEDEGQDVKAEVKTESSTTGTEQTKKSTKQHSAIDYNTLLSFAARIGKHNAAAAIEAERQSNRRPTPTQPQSQLQTQTDSERATQPNPAETQPTEPSTQPTTEESQAELAAINDTLASQRAARGMAFPIAEVLRLGALGRLQYLREQEGEDAVDREVERIVRESEQGRLVKEDAVKEENVQTQVSRPVAQAATAVQQQQQQRTSLPAAPPSLPPKPKIALDLDFPGSDDDDDD